MANIILLLAISAIGVLVAPNKLREVDEDEYYEEKRAEFLERKK